MAHKAPAGSITVPGTFLADLAGPRGVPDDRKIDIDGADCICLQSLSATLCPKFSCRSRSATTSNELLDYLEGIG